MQRIVLTTLAIALLPLTSLRADVTLPKIFGDHMVLQGEKKLPIWGTAEAGEKVTVTALSQEKSAVADDKGKWRIELEPIESKDPIEVKVAGKNTITFKDVLVGEVWFCSGQSNMGFSLKTASNAKSAIAAADRPTMRLFTVGRATPDHPLDDVPGGEWVVCSPETAPQFSAVAYFFGVELQQDLKKPIGLIHSSWGGTRAEAWIPKPTFDALKLSYEPQWTEEWLHPKQPAGTTKPVVVRPHEAPAVLYNGMVAPIVGYAMRGVIWYQGETNTAYPKEYYDVLKSLVTSWRDVWKQGDFPFLIVQLSAFGSPGRDWPTLRDSQTRVAADVPNSGIAVTIDVGLPKNIHPTDKLTVGKRLSLVARKVAYHEEVVSQGPTFKSAEATGDKVTIHLDHTDGGLVAKGGNVEGFELAGDDGKFVEATATIVGDTIVATADGVSDPKHVRYAWANVPACTLYNGKELPAAPFEGKVEHK